MAPPAANPTDPTLYTTAKRGSPALPPPERPAEGERSGETAVARWIGGEISEIALCYCAGEGDVLGSSGVGHWNGLHFTVDWSRVDRSCSSVLVVGREMNGTGRHIPNTRPRAANVRSGAVPAGRLDEGLEDTIRAVYFQTGKLLTLRR
jgi:hypothetical protein